MQKSLQASVEKTSLNSVTQLHYLFSALLTVIGHNESAVASCSLEAEWPHTHSPAPSSTPEHSRHSESRCDSYRWISETILDWSSFGICPLALRQHVRLQLISISLLQDALQSDMIIQIKAGDRESDVYWMWLQLYVVFWLHHGSVTSSRLKCPVGASSSSCRPHYTVRYSIV